MCRYDEEGRPEFASARGWDDGVIDPADTRRVLSLALGAAVHGYTHGTPTTEYFGCEVGPTPVRYHLCTFGHAARPFPVHYDHTLQLYKSAQELKSHKWSSGIPWLLTS